MKKKLRIASKPCNRCGGLISWEEKLDGKFPTHVDRDGFIIDDGRCPEFKKTSRAYTSNSLEKMKLFSTQKFDRFNLKPDSVGYTLPIFQGKDPLLPRFYIGKISLELDAYKKIIKIPKLFNLNTWSLAYGIIRYFLERHKIISFFKILKADKEEDTFIHIFIIPSQTYELSKIDTHIIEFIDKRTPDLHFTSNFIINQDLIKETINLENIENYISSIKKFFDALVFEIKNKMKGGQFLTTIHFDLIKNNLFFFVDIDVKFFGKGKPATIADKGSQILGELKHEIHKYRLIEITNTPVTSHLKSPEYSKFIEFARDKFENRGFPRKRDDKNEWTIKDYWEKINDVLILDNDIISIVENYKETKFFFPFSRLFKIEKKDIPKELRFMMIQKAKKELFQVLQRHKEHLRSYSPSIEIILLEQIIPKFYDLTAYPMYAEFAGNVSFEIKRSKQNIYQLNKIPQELLKSSGYNPIAGKFDFFLVPIVPSDLSSKEVENTFNLLRDIAHNFKSYKLSENVNINEFIKYEFNREDISNKKHSKWATVFDKQFAPKLRTVNSTLRDRKIIAIPLIGLRNMGLSSQLFKYYIQNEFYKLLKAELSTLHFGVIQSFLVDDYKRYKGSKLACILYKNSLFNIAANNPTSYIAKRIKNGILFKFKYPFGTMDITRPRESIEMQAGFDASKIEGVEYSKPRGAVVVTLDPYGKQVRSKYIRDARTHKGLISESVIKDLIVEIIEHQQQLIEDGLKDDLKFPKKIIFLFDGDINNHQKKLFIKVYKELIETEEYPILPEFYIFEVLKSHPMRMYLVKDSKIDDVPFGVMTLLNEKEFVIKSHMWTRNTMTQPQLYRFKMRLSQRYKDIEQYTVLETELENIAVQLFQSTLFNTGKGGRPLKESFVIHESHKLSQEFASKADSIGLLYYKD